MAQKNEWEERAANVLKAQLKLHGLTYAQLVEKLHAIGVEEKEANIKNKLSRGKFSAAFFFACMGAIGVNEVRV